MNKVKKRGLKKSMLTFKLKACFIVVFIFYLCSATLLKNVNVDLDHQLQSMIYDNEVLKQNNQTKLLKIDELSSFDRLSSIAKSNGLENYEGSIKNVK
ncbi:MAG: hypothetical protein LBT75_00515 [Bacilli bacterium]|jgi:cell division protein FtsL|nr:hypothetical protein [Bacilli bacterium]